MSLAPYGSAALAAWRSDQTFRMQKGELASLQAQLSTGQAADSYAGLGASASKSLSARSTLSTIEGYASNVSDARLRLALMSQGVEQVGRLASALSASLPGTFQQTPIGQTTAQVSAEDGFRQTIAILNTEVDGRYLFSGRTAATEPVASYELILDGDGDRAGLKQLVAERKAADLGPDGLGRLRLAASGATVGLSEEAAGLPFGLKILSAAATGGRVIASTSAGPPAAADLSVASSPVEGDVVSVELGLPDGTTTHLVLTAKAGDVSGSPAAFAIGTSPAETAANLRGALELTLRTTASTALASASAIKAATAFFAGSASNPPERVAGPPYVSATATVAGTAADTVIWYRGDDDSGSARETAPVRTGDGAAVAIGARANEPGFRNVLTALGALAADTFAAADPTSQARYGATADRIASGLATPPISAFSADLAVADASLRAATDRLSAARSQFQDVVDGVESADPSEVAAKLLATQTRLQASYQTTSVIAKLSLVDFI